MATTTPNYGWVVPTSTDLVKDGATAIETLGDSADATVKALNPETTLGDISYRSATANTKTRLGIGSTGNVLTVAGGVPTWAAPAGGGKLLQVVQGTYSTQTIIASTSYTDTGLSLAITPTLATSKILVTVAQQYNLDRSSSIQSASFQIMRGASSVFDTGSNTTGPYIASGGASSISLGGYTTLMYLDSPATTSATTYSVQARVQYTANFGQIACQLASGKSTITLMEIGA